MTSTIILKEEAAFQSAFVVVAVFYRFIKRESVTVSNDRRQVLADVRPTIYGTAKMHEEILNNNKT